MPVIRKDLMQPKGALRVILLGRTLSAAGSNRSRKRCDGRQSNGGNNLKSLRTQQVASYLYGVLALLGLTLGTSAAASSHAATAHVGAAAQTPCVPTEQLNGKELAARLAWMKAHNG